MSLPKSVRRRLWDLERFGFSPKKLLSPRADAPRVMCLCVPKSGTHLLERILCLYPPLYRPLMPTINGLTLKKHGGDFPGLLGRLKPGQIAICHLNHTPQREAQLRESPVKALLSVRDPRDIVVSGVFYIQERPTHPRYHQIEGRPMREAIVTLLEEPYEPGQPSFREQFDKFTGWTDTVKLVRFEDLIGKAQDRAAMAEEIRGIFMHLGIELDPAEAERIAAGAVSDVSPTFRKGKSGGWREHFDEEAKTVFKEKTGDLLQRLGYERDGTW